ncbi:MAG TPA: FAD-dependent oxidoreductase [Gammaproteobacteria bacterium]|nr:FAD-dependent oxidoreductase [Gammaproteobacteria bacterium]
MPALSRPVEAHAITLPPRRALLAAQTDVLVVGGGPAGLGAAVGAAEAGARVVLAERYGFLGGNATAALVMPLMSFHTQRAGLQQAGITSLLPDDHGPGHSVIGGVLRDVLERLVKAGGAIAPSLETGYVVPFDPEIFKCVSLDLLDESGVEFLFHALATEVLTDATGVVFETKSGSIAIKAHTIVDCTGDGDIAARAGAKYEIGRESDGLVQPMTLYFRMVEFQRAAFEAYVKQHPEQWRGVYGLWDLIKQAEEAGELNLAREDILFFATPHEHEVAVNSTRVTKVLGIDVWDLSYAEWESRRQMRQIAAFFRRYVPGFERTYIAQSGVNIGVRETRRIVGEYRLTAEDLLRARKFDDVIARGSYPVDIHNPEGKGTTLKRLPPGEAYDVPLRALIPKGIEHLIVAGRCISGTHEAHSSYRVMPISMATGHAAGVCAALAAKSGKSPRDIPAVEVQQELVRQGANIGDPQN